MKVERPVEVADGEYCRTDNIGIRCAWFSRVTEHNRIERCTLFNLSLEDQKNSMGTQKLRMCQKLKIS